MINKQLKLLVFNLSTDPFAVRVIGVTLWRLVNTRLLLLQNNFFFGASSINGISPLTQQFGLFLCHENCRADETQSVIIGQ